MDYNITDGNFEEIKNSGQPMVIDFSAEWCGPCRTIAPIIDELAAEYAGKVFIGKCNVDENNDLAAKFLVRSIPTVVFLKPGGEMSDKQVGMAGKDVFKAKVDALL